jgi:ATP/ADP translocase/HEAT repeat protein
VVGATLTQATQPLLRRLAVALLIRQGEGRRTALLFAHLMLASAVFVLGRTVRDTLFLSRYSMSALPWMFVLYGAASAITVVVYGRVAGKLPRDKAIVAWSALGIVTYVATWAAVKAGSAIVLPIFYVWSEVFANLLISQFWTQTNDLLDVRAQKRLLGTIGSARVLGVVVVGLGTGWIVRAIGTAQLLFVLSGLLIAVGVLALVIGKEPRALVPKSRGTAAKHAPAVLSNPHVVGLSLMLLCAFTALTIGDYQFKAIARLAYDGDELARFFSFFYAATGTVSFLFQIFLTPRLLSRFGVGAGMSVMPVVFGAASALLLGVPHLAIASVMKFADNGFQYTVHDTTLQALYVPFPAATRVRTRAFLDAVVKPLAYAIGGLVLVALASTLGEVKLSYVAVAVTLPWLALVPVVRARYLAALSQTLSARGAAAFQDEAVLDAGALGALRRSLDSSDPRVALAAVSEMGAAGGEAARATCERLVTHADPAIRVASLERLETAALSLEHAEELVVPALRDAVPEVRAAAAHVWARVATDDAVDELTSLLDDPAREVRAETLAGLLGHGGFEGALVGGARIGTLLESPHASDRIDAARALGHLGKSGHRRLRGLLGDADASVRAAAARAAASVKDVRLVPLLLPLLADAKASRAATQALAAIGPSAVPALTAALDDETRSRATRLILPRVLRGIPAEASYAALRARVAVSDSHLRLRVVGGMAGIRWAMGRPPEPLSAVREWLARELAHTARMVAGWEAARSRATSQLLDEAVAFRTERGTRRILRILELRYEAAPLRLVRARLSDPSRRANALEVLDTLLEPAIRRVVMPWLDEGPVLERLARCGLDAGRIAGPEAFLSMQCRHPNPYVGAVALDALARSARDPLLRELALAEAQHAVLSREPLVREAGIFAVQRCRGASPLDLPDDDPDPVVARALRLVREGRSEEDADVYSTLEKLVLLRASSVFHGIQGEDLAPLARIAEHLVLAPGESVFAEHDTADALFVIIRGRVRIHRGDDQLAVLSAGEPFGEMAALDGSPRSASATAMEDTELLRIGSDEFYEVLHEQVELAEGIIRTLIARLRAADAALGAACGPSTRHV